MAPAGHRWQEPARERGSRHGSFVWRSACYGNGAKSSRRCHPELAMEQPVTIIRNNQYCALLPRELVAQLSALRDSEGLLDLLDSPLPSLT